MKTRLLLSSLLAVLLAGSSAACTPLPDEPDNPILPTHTPRPPKNTPETALQPTETSRPHPTLTRTRPAKSPVSSFTLTQALTEPGAFLSGEEIGFFDAGLSGLGAVTYAFLTDYGRHMVFIAGGGTTNPQVYIGGAPFSSPVEYPSGNNLTTRADVVLLADYSPRENGDVTLWQVDAEGKASIIKAIREPALTVISLEFSPDGSRLAVGYNNGEIRLYETTGGSLARTIQAHQDEVTSMAFSPDGRTLVTDSWSFDPFTYVFDTTSGARIATLSSESYEPGVVSFSPDGTLVAATSFDGTHIYSTSNWTASGGFVPGVWEGRFTCDNQMLMVTYGEGRTEFYSLTSGELTGTLDAGPLYCTITRELLALVIDPARNGVAYISYTP